MKHYILNDCGEPVHEPDLQKWADWFAQVHNDDLYVNHTAIGASVIASKFVPTVLDDNSGHVWETRVLGGILDQVTDRCAGGREQAEAMHAKMVERVKSEL